MAFCVKNYLIFVSVSGLHVIISVGESCFFCHRIPVYRVLIKFEDIALLLITSEKSPFNLKTLQAYKPFQYQRTHNIATSTTILHLTKNQHFLLNVPHCPIIYLRYCAKRGGI